MLLAKNIVDCVTADTQALLDQIPALETSIAAEKIIRSTRYESYWTRARQNAVTFLNNLQAQYSSYLGTWNTTNMSGIFRVESQPASSVVRGPPPTAARLLSLAAEEDRRHLATFTMND